MRLSNAATGPNLALGACEGKHSTTNTQPPQPVLRSYTTTGLSFAYPATWNVREPGNIAGVGGRLYPFVCLNTEQLAPCGNFDRPLPPNGVDVLWSAVETPKPKGGHSV